MNKYETMFILKPDLSEEERKNLLLQLNEAVTKNGGTILNSSIWAERKKLFFPLKRYHEGVYYLLNFSIEPKAISDIRQAYKLNENVLRTLITK
jgi:small subunit ribosomal protein S6